MEDKELRNIQSAASDLARHAQRLKRETNDRDEEKFYRAVADFADEVERL
jgi:hypothetical protein